MVVSLLDNTGFQSGTTGGGSAIPVATESQAWVFDLASLGSDIVEPSRVIDLGPTPDGFARTDGDLVYVSGGAQDRLEIEGRVVDIESGAVVARQSIASGFAIASADGSRVAWGDPETGTIEVRNVGTGGQDSISVDPGLFEFGVPPTISWAGDDEVLAYQSSSSRSDGGIVVYRVPAAP